MFVYVKTTKTVEILFKIKIEYKVRVEQWSIIERVIFNMFCFLDLPWSHLNIFVIIKYNKMLEANPNTLNKTKLYPVGDIIML